MRSRTFGGVAGNEALTFAAAAVLTVLLLAEGVTILDVGGLLHAHMFIGLLLLGPLGLKLSSTGYRFVRYYTGSPRYRAKGPPQTLLRMLAPPLVLATAGVFATGIALMALGARGGVLLELHKIAFVAWGALFGVHFLAYAPRVLRALAARRAVAGARLRGLAIGAAVGGGLTLALALLSAIDAWHGGDAR